MINTAIMTDSNSGITQKEAKELGVTLLPMPFMIDGNLYLEGIDLTHEQFYEMLTQGADVSTSQPSPGNLMDQWGTLLQQGYQEIIYIPMSSGLSQSCSNAALFAAEYDGKVQVVDNKRISVTQRQSVLDALALAKAGKSALEIREILEREALDASIYITVDTLTYLKKGGRVTAAGAAIGTVLNMKPVLTIQGDKLEAYSKVRGMKAARRTMIEAMKADYAARLKELHDKEQLRLFIAYSYVGEDIIRSWKEEVEEAFPNMEVYSDPLTLSVGCHIGPGALAIATSIYRPMNN